MTVKILRWMIGLKSLTKAKNRNYAMQKYLEYKAFSKWVENLLQEYFLYYEKAMLKAMVNMILNATQANIDEKDCIYRQRVVKIQSNVST